MESRFNRPRAANLIGRVLDEVDRQWAEEPEICGLSREMTVYQALKKAGYLVEDAMVRDNF